MIRSVSLSKRARRDLRRVPDHVARKLKMWVGAVSTLGLQEVRRVPGWHDEPLKGKRQGQRSIRLSRAYRAIYEIQADGRIEFVIVEEVNKHDY